MSRKPQPERRATGSRDFDVVIVGASLAGCTTAILLARAGASVALVEKQPDPSAFKRMCTHHIQPSAVPTLERLGLLEPMVAAGAVRSHTHIWTRWGWMTVPPELRIEPGINLRRETLDPIVREMAGATPGVELMLGRSAQHLVCDREGICGVLIRDRDGQETALHAQLVVGADGRDSQIAEMAGLAGRKRKHGRFYYGAYFEDPSPSRLQNTQLWLLNPHWVARFPTDAGLTLYSVMPTKDRLPEFKRDPAAALISFIAGIPEAPPIRELRQASKVFGKLDIPDRVRKPIAPGVALVGDAALALDPEWGVGCSWAFQSGEWLTDSIAPALRGEETVWQGLRRYRRRHAGEVRGHTLLINDFSTGRRFRFTERTLLAAASRDLKTKKAMTLYATRLGKPGRTLGPAFPRAIAVNARHMLKDRSGKGADQRREAVVGRNYAAHANHVQGRADAENGSVERPQRQSSEDRA